MGEQIFDRALDDRSEVVLVRRRGAGELAVREIGKNRETGVRRLIAAAAPAAVGILGRLEPPENLQG